MKTGYLVTLVLIILSTMPGFTSRTSDKPLLTREMAIHDNVGFLTEEGKREIFEYIENFYQKRGIPIFVVLSSSTDGKEIQELNKDLIRKMKIDRPFNYRAILLTYYWKENKVHVRYGTGMNPQYQMNGVIMDPVPVSSKTGVSTRREPTIEELSWVDYRAQVLKDLKWIDEYAREKNPLGADLGSRALENDLMSGKYCGWIAVAGFIGIVILVGTVILKIGKTRTPRGVTSEYEEFNRYDHGSTMQNEFNTPYTSEISRVTPVSNPTVPYYSRQVDKKELYTGTETPFTVEREQPPSESPWGSSDEHNPGE